MGSAYLAQYLLFGLSGRRVVLHVNNQQWFESA
jgi:hypothetical protein